MARTLIGSKVRERRRALGVTQAKLAQLLGISASYLNLIEADRRNIGGALLKRIADALEVPLDQFDGAAERRLVDELGEIAADPLVAPLGLEPSSAADLASRHAGWARALVSVHRSYLDRHEAVGALSDRLGQDPFLADAVHGVLTRVTAIHAASEILAGEDVIDDAQRRRFLSIIADDSRRLAEVSQALAGFFTRTHPHARSVTPLDELDDFVIGHDNHFPALEAAAQSLCAAAGLPSAQAENALEDHLLRAYGLAVRRVPQDAARSGDRTAAPPARLDRGARSIDLMMAAPEATRRFQLALAVAELGAADAISAEIDGARTLVSEVARRRARQALTNYVAAAMLMPYEAFHAATLAVRYDVHRLGRQFHASVEQVCHRLITLRRPGAEGVRLGFMRADPAGHVAKRMPLPRLPLPRYGTACPMWAVYRAFQTPGTVVRQLVEFPSSERYLLVACTVERDRADPGLPRHLLSVMLACNALHADQLVYGDGPRPVSGRAGCSGRSGLPCLPARRLCVSSGGPHHRRHRRSPHRRIGEAREHARVMAG